MKTLLVLPLTLIAGIALGVGGVFGFQHFSALHKSASQPYAGQDQRKISSLSARDIAALEKGEGWGLAKPAELNGYPGPAHIIEFAEELALSAEQRSKIDASFAAMNKRAKALGRKLINAEATLDEAFRSKEISSIILSEHLNVAGNIRAKLRGVHLIAHLEVTPLLNEEQKQKYQQLRGYNNGDHSGHSEH